MINLLLILQLSVVNQPLPIKQKEYRDSSKNFIVLHNDGGPGGYKVARNTLIKRKLSYHYYVKRDGTVIKLLDPKYKASHVGVSFWNGIFRLNNYSIAICLEDGIKKPYTFKQYKSTAKLINIMQRRYNDTTSRIIVGHKDVAFPFGRKTDPENFDWDKLFELIRRGG